MKQIFDAAMLWELVDLQANPMTLVRLANPGAAKKQRRILTPDEFQAIVAKVPEQFRLMVIVAGCLGLRVCEILGLQWGNVDWKKLELHIQRDVVLATPGDVKTPASMAIVPLDAQLATLLLKHRRNSQRVGSSDWIFAKS